MIGAACILLFFNSICGFLAIYSYPFTSFPGYTTIYSDQFAQLYIEVQTPEGQWIDVEDILKHQNYRRENNTPYEDGVLGAHEINATDTFDIEQYWILLRSGVKPLRKYNRYRFYRRMINLSPNAAERVEGQELIYDSVNNEDSISNINS